MSESAVALTMRGYPVYNLTYPKVNTKKNMKTSNTPSLILNYASKQNNFVKFIQNSII